MELTTECDKELYKLFNEKDEIISFETFKNRIELLEALKAIQVDADVIVKLAEVRHPIDAEGELNLRVTYCGNCGTNVRAQKYCSNCGSKLNWKSLRENSKFSD